MIISYEGKVRIEGEKSDVLAEATCIMHDIFETLAVREGREAAREELDEIFKLAVMSAKQISEKTEELRRQEGLLC